MIRCQDAQKNKNVRNHLLTYKYFNETMIVYFTSLLTICHSNCFIMRPRQDVARHLSFYLL